MRIQGKLYNSTDKEPLMFANIYTSDSKGTILPSQNGTSSNAAGAFTLDNVDPLGYVTISSISIGKDIIKYLLYRALVALLCTIRNTRPVVNNYLQLQ